MNEYEQQAQNFLKDTETTISINYVGKSINDLWSETTPRNTYTITLKNKKGVYTFTFWDSLNNTKLQELTFSEYCKKYLKRSDYDLTYLEKTKQFKEYEKIKAEATPAAYNVLACLQAYDIGTFNNFCLEFGYNNDSIKAFRIYTACQNEYTNLKKLFNDSELLKLQEIQ